MAQRDLKKLIAYSSVAHMGFVTLGLFIPLAYGGAGKDQLLALGMGGGMVQMISHGFISAALFMCVGVLYDRVHTRRINDFGGVANTMPVFAVLLVLFALANAGLPGTSGFVGEFLVILASFRAEPLVALGAGTILVLGAAYSLYMLKRVVFGEVANDRVAGLEDLDAREMIALGGIGLAVIALGLYPDPLVEMMEPSLDGLARHVPGREGGGMVMDLAFWAPLYPELALALLIPVLLLVDLAVGRKTPGLDSDSVPGRTGPCRVDLLRRRRTAQCSAAPS